MKLKFLLFSVVFLLFLISSCSNVKNDQVDIKTEDVQTEENIADEESISTTAVPTSRTPVNTSDNMDDLENNEVDNKTSKNTKSLTENYNISKSLYDLLYNNLILNISKESLDDTIAISIEDEQDDSELQTLDPILITSFNIKDDLDKYIANYLPSFTKIAESKFVYSKRLKLTNIQSFSKIINANVVLIKTFQDVQSGKFVYHIMYLTGDVESETNYWYRSTAEAYDLTETFARLKITNINDYNNILNKDQQAEYLQKQQKLAQAEKSDEEDAIIAAENDIIDYEAKIQKQMIGYRVEKLVGLFRDIHTNKIYEIKELKTKDPNDKNYTMYAGYIFVSEDQDPDIFLPITITNSTLSWLVGDLAFQFSGKDGRGYYISNEKMLTEATVTPYPYKGYIQIKLTNNNYRYLVPVLNNQTIDSVYNDFYSEIIKLKINENYDTQELESYKIGTKNIKGVNSTGIWWIIPLGLFIAISFLA